MKFLVTFILSFFLINFSYGGSDKFLIEPYLLDVTTESATVAFHLNEPLNATVRVFLDEDIKVFKSDKLNTSHFINITGLLAGTVYRYQVFCGEGKVKTSDNDRSYQIRTSGKLGESFSFVVYGDSRPGDIGTPFYHKKIVEQVSMIEPSFSLLLGDLVDDGDKINLWTEFFEIESELLRKQAVYPVMGDNDYENGKGLIADFFPKLETGYYRFEWNEVQFFGLNAWDTRGNQSRSELEVTSNQIQWLIKELSKEEVQKAPYRIVFLHDPIYISRGRASEILLKNWHPIFEKYNVDVVFSSWHLYERSQYKDITYVISGGGGAELIWMSKNQSYPSQVDAKRHHFCRVDVNSNSLTIRAIADDGTVLDNLTLSPKSNDANVVEATKRLVSRLNKKMYINEDKGFPLLAVYIFSYDCSYCKKLIKHDLPSLADRYKTAVEINYLDLAKTGTYDIFLKAGEDFGRQSADVPAIFIGNKVLGGKYEIKEQLSKEFELFVEDTALYKQNSITPFQQGIPQKNTKQDAFNAITFGIVLFAGLLDGVNPCAFTTIIFLISYLSLVGTTRRRILYSGSFYVLAIFITYFLIGLAFFSIAKVILNNSLVSTIINVMILLAVLVLGILSFIDYIRCLRGKTDKVILQLPGSIKEKIRDNIRNYARNRVAIMGASFLLGIVIAGMELTCTGQVYIPIVTLISEPSYRLQALFYLVVYNIAFIIPLLAVFLVTALGVTSDQIKLLFEKHVASVKLGFVILFGIMAIIMVINLKWLL